MEPTSSSEITSTTENEDRNFFDGLTSTYAEQWGKNEIEDCILALQHAIVCDIPDGACNFCGWVKRKVVHMEHCMERRTIGCAECNEAVEWMTFHARTCTFSDCGWLYCAAIKKAIQCYPPGSYHLVDLDHLIHRFIRRLQDLSPFQQTLDEEDGEAQAKGQRSEEDGESWRRPGRIQNPEISSTSAD